MNFVKLYIGDWRNHEAGRWAAYRVLPNVDRLPRFAGVYCVYLDGSLVYIGSSADISNRFPEHKLRYGYRNNVHTPWGSFDGVSTIDLKVRRSRVLGDWAMWEIRLIRRLQPKFNRQHRGRLAAA